MCPGPSSGPRLRRSLWQPPRLAEHLTWPGLGEFAAGVLFAVLAVFWLLAARGDRPQYRRTSGVFVTGTAACAIALAGRPRSILLLGIPWGFAVARRLAGGADPPGTPQA